ncbi:aminotransferase [bacterium (Candidatus Blackallbacteria) CG17_big_fil_post_rev_8_21_14_2_50_48_46]|uniref:Aminotransferase n=1 Tax=bacterium (Candidatus Blackallbacteria) CG17_big_fil_post_rev_8_21_14_2_50_48_46 TaxID=2014261 RepID=A0A2M7G833_9BACT|nr:MAG: aminotransferase [bacterium (Candidatus Blackallbacteria) CG18_big_fil_WC_8_21_14_2_50_49_26]PIW17935.1 MAG: aminotransferase [bacterium (Candidatus Blackallbacteria) CG17_big_fil_post_rev_8_21_14_2_50_48_46]PIW45754.1 MAG: aminotransferase [bacterium (Candidatus Blackallbacteria) CG13_big_fil_rev_8_21_14_2_50_49_14]
MLTNELLNPKYIYLDYQATTPLDPRVKEKMLTYMDADFGNASSADHEFGSVASKAVKAAKKQVAALVGANPRDVYFTSGTTESINLAIQGYVHKHKQPKKPFRLATLPIEHKAVLDTCKFLESKKLIELVFLKINSEGQVDINDLAFHAQKGLDFLAVMAANNEVGTIYPVKTIAEIANSYQIPFFCDASQAAGKIPLEFDEWGLQFLALTGHKMYGPKGCGALIMEHGIEIEPLFYGGGHQNGIRPGTLNVPGIVGLGEACFIRQLEMFEDERAISKMRNQLQSLLSDSIPNLKINGDLNQRLSGNLHISIPGIENQMMISHLRSHLAISTGSACTSGLVEPSFVLQAMGLSYEQMEGALRISLGKFTTEEEVQKSAQLIIDAYHKIKSLIS